MAVLVVWKTLTEMKGFEPLRRLPDLPHFECGPFSHLGTSPETVNIITALWKTVKLYFNIMQMILMRHNTYDKCNINEKVHRKNDNFC